MLCHLELLALFGGFFTLKSAILFVMLCSALSQHGRRFGLAHTTGRVFGMVYITKATELLEQLPAGYCCLSRATQLLQLRLTLGFVCVWFEKGK